MDQKPRVCSLCKWRLLVALPAVLCLSTLAFAQAEWAKYDGNPVLEPGAPGEWDDGWVASGDVYYDGSTFHMWYLGGGAEESQIGYAISSDGLVWTKHPANPVLEMGGDGAWDDAAVDYPSVLWDGDSFHMWYAGYSDFDPPAMQIGHATSADGVAWIKHPGNPVFGPGAQGSWDDLWVGTGTVLLDGTTFKLWYQGAHAVAGGWRASIGYATSADGVIWDRRAEPVLTSGSGWDSEEVYNPEVVYDAATGSFDMWYTGWGPLPQQIGFASSRDGVLWAKSLDNPVLTVGSAGDWDSQAIHNVDVVLEGTTAHMWYTAWSAGPAAVGYASASVADFVLPPPPLNDRFLVEAWWWDSDGNVGTGSSIPLTDDSVCFWFFDQDNVELLVKVLDGCTVNGRYWVFAAGMTDVGVSITVTDLFTDDQMYYTNTLGEVFQPVQDTAAFDICD